MVDWPFLLGRGSPLWKQAWILWNPSAGRGRSQGLDQKIERELAPLAQSTRLLRTQSADHLRELAAQARAEGIDLVWVAGGDGTVHLACRGLLEKGQGPVPTLGILPLGSANDLAFCLGLRHGWWTNGSPQVARIDHGWIRINDQEPTAFVNGVGVGLNAMVTIRSRKIRFFRGLALYTFALLQALCWDWRELPWRITRDGDSWAPGPASRGWLALSVMNGRREGNFDLAPMANPADGKLELLGVVGLARWRALNLLPRLIAGGLGEHPPWVNRSGCRELGLESESDLAIHADGELVAVPGEQIRRVRITLEPGGLPVLVGPGFGAR